MMKKRMLAAIMAATVLFSSVIPGMEANAAQEASVQTGTTYYVSTLHGRDSYDGKSERTPFYSLRKINHMTLKPGDKILLECGSVFKNGYLHLFGQSGTEDAPIVIDQYGTGDDPVIDTNGQGIWYQNYGYRLDNTSSATHQYKGYVSSSILLYDTEYIEIQNIEIVNKAPEIETDYNASDTMARTGVAAVAQDKGTIDHIHLKNLNIHDVIGNVYQKHMNNGGIYFTVYMPHDAVVSGDGSEKDFVSSETGVPRYNDVLIDSCSVTNTNRWGIAVGYSALWGKFKGAAISDDTIREYGSTNVVIQNNYIKDAGGDGITVMYCDRPLIQYNVADGIARQMHTGDYLSSVDGGQRFAAGIWPWKCKDALFQYNEAFDTQNINQENGDGQAWDADYGDGTVYQYNYSHNNGGGCLMVCLGEAYRTTFRYNISQNDLKGALCIFGSPMTHIYNNVFYVDGGRTIYRSGKNGGTAILENNIFYNGDDAPLTDSWTEGNLTYSNNLFYNFANTPDDAAKIVLEKSDTPNIFVDPASAPTSAVGSVRLHENPAVRSVFDGYKLTEGSAARGKGKVISDVHNHALSEKDFFGNSLTGVTTFDIGAHQYQESENSETLAPPAPQKIGAAKATDTTITLSWPAVLDSVGITGYKILDGDTVIKELSGAALEEAYNEETQTISVVIRDLNPGTTYEFSIIAYDAAGRGSAAEKVSFTTARAKEDLKEDEKLNAAVSNAWNVIQEEEGVSSPSKAYEDLVAAYEKALQIKSDDPIASIKVVLEELNQALIRYEKEKNPGGNQEEIKAEKLAAPAVAEVKASAGKDGVKVSVSWNPVANAASYTLNRTVNGSTTSVTGITAASYNDTTLYGGKEVSYSVIAVSGDKARYTDSNAGAPKSIKLAKAPAKLKVKQKAGKATLSWKKLKGVKKYFIYRSDKKDGVYKQVGTAKKNKTSYVDKKAKKKKTYYYKIAATVKGNVTAMTNAKKLKMK